MYLNAHSHYSLRYGTLSIEELVQQALAQGVSALALTDINNSTGILDFARQCNEAGIQPIAGIEFRNGDEWLYTGIARNNEGFRELNAFLSHHNITRTPLPERAGVLNHAYIIYPLGKALAYPLREYEYIGVRPQEVNQLRFGHPAADVSRLVIHQPLTFKNAQGYELHRHLRAIDHNLLLSQVQAGHVAAKNEWLMPMDVLLKAYEALPGIVGNTEKLIGNCHFTHEPKKPKNRKTFTGSAYEDRLLLEKLALEGMSYRYGDNHTQALARIQSELDIIDKLDFCAYFLIAWDVIRFSLSKGFYHVGRGSGANSVIAYCLKITDVDPIELDLYFERFLNPKRKSPPDFDIDYSWKERDEVIRYIFNKYGAEHTALLGTISTFGYRSSIRELGKVYGLPKGEIDILADQKGKINQPDELVSTILAYSTQMADFPNMRSIHAGGILITEEPITCYTALDMPPKGFPTAQWDMYVAEVNGIDKLDILSQRGIGHIKDAAAMVLQNQGIKVDVHDVEKFKVDENVRARLIDGNTIGCFYVESPAMRGLLKKLRCYDYTSLIAASSIIRPGVAKSGMMREFILRFHNQENIKYLHPIMKEQLHETYGVMVYQEDVLKVCHYFAGLDLGDADVLRRMMSGKSRQKKDFEELMEKFFGNCRAFGYEEVVTKEVWRQIESFAGYSFSKAHSASYAVESYQSMYLKTYYPLEFMVGVINNFGGFYRTWVYVNEARKCGATICLPCVNKSDYTTTIEGSNIYLGFIHLENLESSIGEAIVSERQHNGPYTGLENFIARLKISLEQLIILIKIDALRFTGRNKKQLMWDAHLLLGKATRHKPSAENMLFETPVQSFTLPVLTHQHTEDAFDEIELLGFPVSMTSFDLLQTSFRGEVMAKQLIHYVGKKVRMVGELVATKDVRTVKKDLMNFGTFLDVEGNFFDTVHFAKSLTAYPFKGRGLYLLLGKVVEEFDFPSVEIEKMAKLPMMQDSRY